MAEKFSRQWFLNQSREAHRDLAETAIATPGIFPEYGEWVGARQALELAHKQLAAAEAKWLKRIEPALQDDLLRALAERKGLVPKSSKEA